MLHKKVRKLFSEGKVISFLDFATTFFIALFPLGKGSKEGAVVFQQRKEITKLFAIDITAR
jgi:hypothetical protein